MKSEDVNESDAVMPGDLWVGMRGGYIGDALIVIDTGRGWMKVALWEQHSDNTWYHDVVTWRVDDRGFLLAPYKLVSRLGKALTERGK